MLSTGADWPFQSKVYDHTSDTSAEDNLHLFPRVTSRSHRLPSEKSRKRTVKGSQLHALTEWREGKTDSGGRGFLLLSKTGLYLLKFGCSFFSYIRSAFTAKKNNATGSTCPKPDTLVLLICRNTMKFSTVISEVTEH